ncbi:hypothetical protein RQM59_13640 [Flavobacteriaceae bacterium S356]|uniref:DUF3976 domain-containing protein n=1 Tax=Asprobacillus argus TaxID=3076534 RepID=A0ABU3LI92_9FLAO|nr:hypothetical protein [Flavobacteriaceae bacterium S356]
MLTGILMILLSLVGFYAVRKSDMEEEALVKGDPMGRLYLYLGILILLVVGVISIIGDIY